MFALFLLAIFVIMVDTSGLSLDEKMTKLLYVEEQDEEQDLVFNEEDKEAVQEVFGSESESSVSEKEVMDAISQIYKGQ